MLSILINPRVRNAILCSAVLTTATTLAGEAHAFHRRAVVVYVPVAGAPACPQTYVGPSSFDNPVGTGFGGYCYGGYPNYGYWGYLPGVYAGYGGVAPAPGYATCPYTVPLAPAAVPCATMPIETVACPAGPACAPVAVTACAPACEPVCMTRCQYRRYVRRMCRAMACCSYLPPAASCYGALLGADAFAAPDLEDDLAVLEGTSAEKVAPAGETVSSPLADETPEPLLERSL